VDYFSNTNPPTYPDGLDIEIITFKALEQASQETSAPFDREHVTPYLRKSGKFKTAALQHSQDLSALRWTVDEPADFAVIENVFLHYRPRIDFTWNEVLALQSQQPELFNMNQHIIRNAGMKG
jgi:glutamate-1-semialdehyde 2,1-aminomutase